MFCILFKPCLIIYFQGFKIDSKVGTLFKNNLCKFTIHDMFTMKMLSIFLSIFFHISVKIGFEIFVQYDENFPLLRGEKNDPRLISFFRHLKLKKKNRQFPMTRPDLKCTIKMSSLVFDRASKNGRKSVRKIKIIIENCSK